MSLLENVLQTQSPEPHWTQRSYSEWYHYFIMRQEDIFGGVGSLLKCMFPGPPTPLSQFPEKRGAWREGMGPQNLHFQQLPPRILKLVLSRSPSKKPCNWSEDALTPLNLSFRKLCLLKYRVGSKITELWNQKDLRLKAGPATFHMTLGKLLNPWASIPSSVKQKH